MERIRHSHHTRESVFTTDLSRRGLLRGVVGGGLAAATASGLLGFGPVASSRAAAPAVAVPFTGETYVGDTSEPDLLVAIVIGDAAVSRGNGEARAYLCKTPVQAPRGVDAWLTGAVVDDTFDLQSENGVRLEGRLEHGAVTGTATLADGTVTALFASRAIGAAGLYSGPLQDRRLAAVSAEGGSLEALIAATPDETLVLPNDAETGEHRKNYPVVGILTPRNGAPVTMTVSCDLLEDADRLWVIATNDGRYRGAGKARNTSNYIDWTSFW